MHPTLSSQIAQAMVADRHRRAEQDALARTARQARRPHERRPWIRVPRLPVIIARRVLTA
jgi:hypothetical protein